MVFSERGKQNSDRFHTAIGDVARLLSLQRSDNFETNSARDENICNALTTFFQQDCRKKTAKCTSFTCKVDNFESRKGVQIVVSARIWNATLLMVCFFHTTRIKP